MAFCAINDKTEATRGAGPLKSGQRKATAPVKPRQALEDLAVMAFCAIVVKTEATRGAVQGNTLFKASLN
ncbi:hypothetical protein D9754_12265 [Planomicrobium sp. Y74]|nr:hypothetical protein D9754_12265 [Planomicrobium sp. Y74]